MRADRKDESYTPDMPELIGAEHLLTYLWDAGPIMLLGMGASPLTHAEIMAWQSNIGIELSAWEARTLRRLSAAYLSESQEARSPSCPSPIAPVELTAEERTSVSNKVQSIMRSFMKPGIAKVNKR